ncbi:hypothetical protein PAMA_014810 [Pampus argenteus]
MGVENVETLMQSPFLEAGPGAATDDATVPQEQELEEVMSNDSPVTEHQEMLMDSWKMPYNRQKRSPINCRICCGCNGCHRDFCGLCCRA